MGVFTEFLEASTIHGLSHIASSKSIVKPLWMTIVFTGFACAGILINQSFQSWEESPIKTTVQTLPITELTFPKVTVCPPKNTYTNLNYDLLMAENMTIEDDTRIKLIEKAFETLDDHFVQETNTNFTQVEQKNIFFNWYNGYTKILMPYFDDSYLKGLKYYIETTGTEGAIKTKYFRQAFDKSKLNRGMDVTVKIYVPENIRRNRSITLIVNFEVEKFANISYRSVEYTKFITEYYDGQREYKINVTLRKSAFYEFQYKYKIVDEDFQNQNLSKMPGFNLQWKYSFDVNADRKFLVADYNEYVGDYLYSRAFIRYILSRFAL